MPKNNERHRQHNHRIESTDHIKNVPYTLTHDLVRCFDDGFFGWLIKEES